MAEPVALSWSGGKDSAMTLQMLAEDARFEVVALLTTVTADYERISMHGVRVELLRRQGAAVGLPVREVRLPRLCSNADYERAMGRACAELRSQGVGHVAFGDLHLADVRAYREQRLRAAGLTPLFPVWGWDTTAFMQAMLTAGFVARIVCFDPARLPVSAAGRVIDEDFLDSLPVGIDPAGENGEFHTFVSGGPGFAAGVPVRLGERTTREGFCYQDLLPA